MHLKNTPIYYAKYKKKESEVKALMEQVKEEKVAEVTAIKEKKCEHEKCKIGTFLLGVRKEEEIT